MIGSLETKFDTTLYSDIVLGVVFGLFGLEYSLNTWLLFTHNTLADFKWYVSVLLAFGIAVALPRIKSYRPIHFIYVIWMVSFFARFFI